METQDIWDFFEASLFSKSHLGAHNGPVFNIYTDTNPKFERQDGYQIRRANLYNYLASFPVRPTVLIVGEAPGWRGCRFSGVPFTSESQLQRASLPFQGQVTSLRPRPYSEATATIFWKVMGAYYPCFLAWNCVPFHLHRPGDPLTNRRPSNREIAHFIPFLSQLVSLLRPYQVIAVGRCAERTLDLIDIPAIPLRHPSHGGAAAFEQGIQNILDWKFREHSVTPL